MLTVYVPDVGDGLAAGVRTIDGTRIEIDCGSQKDAKGALHKGLCRIDPEVFFLSHYHLDHYNGLLQPECCRSLSRPRIRQVYYPRIPAFKQRKTFVSRLTAMNQRLLGDMAGTMAADLLSVLSRISYTRFRYRSLSMGDTVRVGGAQYKVLWPPKEVTESTTLKVISKAITDFNAAAEEDESLRQILEAIGESGEMRPYISEERTTGELPGRKEHAERWDEFPYPLPEENLPEAVQKANKSLRTAANHLSLAFHEDNKLLFMGDLEKREIQRVVKFLAREERVHFFVMIAPHHGTHWHNDLRKIYSFCTISSVGSRLFRHLSADYKSMSDICLITHFNGDVEVPVLLPQWYGMKRRRYLRTFL